MFSEADKSLRAARAQCLVLKAELVAIATECFCPPTRAELILTQSLPQTSQNCEIKWCLTAAPHSNLSLGRKISRLSRRSPRMGKKHPKLDRKCPRLGRKCPKVDRACPRLGRKHSKLDRKCPELDRTCPRLDRKCPSSFPVTAPQTNELHLYNILSLL